MRRWVAGLFIAAPLLAAGPAGIAATPITLPPGQLPAIISAKAPFVVTREVLVLVPQGPAIRTEEIVTGVNRSKGPMADIQLPLPAGAVGAAGGGRASVVAGPRGMQLVHPVAAGAAVTTSFHFVLSYAGGHVWLPVRYPTGLLSVLVPQGRWTLAGPGFEAVGTMALGPSLRLAGYTTVGPTAGATLPLRLHRVAWWVALGWWVWGPLGGLGTIALGAIGLRAWRRRGVRRKRREGVLIDAVANLDAAYAAGELAESSYRARRQELLEGLGVTHAS